MAISSRITLLGALALWAFQAQAVDVTVAYQTSAEPAKVAQADNTFAKESGAKVDWRKFDSSVPACGFSARYASRALRASSTLLPISIRDCASSRPRAAKPAGVAW